MDFEDIVILIAAAIGWIYSNYRKLQKQAVERAGKLNIPTDINTEEPKPVPVTRLPLKKSFEKPVAKTKVSPVLYDERKKAEEFWSKRLQETMQPAYINADVDKKNMDDVNIGPSPIYINFSGEIHSANMDWRKAIIYSEILRPVYF